MNRTTKRTEQPRKPRSPGKSKAAEFPATSPPITAPLFTPKPLDASQVRRNATVRLRDGREGVVKATGVHRIRIQPASGPSYVVARSEVVAVVAEAPAPKRSGRKAPMALRVPGDAPVGTIADALVQWADEIQARERVLAGLRSALKRLEV